MVFNWEYGFVDVVLLFVFEGWNWEWSFDMVDFFGQNIEFVVGSKVYVEVRFVVVLVLKDLEVLVL